MKIKLEDLLRLSDYFSISIDKIVEILSNSNEKLSYTCDTTKLEIKRKNRLNFDKLGQCTINQTYHFEKWIFDSDDYLKAFLIGYMSYHGYSHVLAHVSDNTNEIGIKFNTGYIK